MATLFCILLSICRVRCTTTTRRQENESDRRGTRTTTTERHNPPCYRPQVRSLIRNYYFSWKKTQYYIIRIMRGIWIAMRGKLHGRKLGTNWSGPVSVFIKHDISLSNLLITPLPQCFFSVIADFIFDSKVREQCFDNTFLSVLWLLIYVLSTTN